MKLPRDTCVVMLMVLLGFVLSNKIQAADNYYCFNVKNVKIIL